MQHGCQRRLLCRRFVDGRCPDLVEQCIDLSRVAGDAVREHVLGVIRETEHAGSLFPERERLRDDVIVVRVVTPVPASGVGAEDLLPQRAIRRVLEEWLDARALQREHPAVAIMSAAQGFCRGRRDQARGQLADIGRFRDEKLISVRLVEDVLLELLVQHRKPAVDHLQSCASFAVQGRPRQYEVLVRLFGETQRLGVGRVFVPRPVYGVDTPEQRRVQQDVVIVRRDLGGDGPGGGADHRIRMRRVHRIEDPERALEPLAGALERLDGVGEVRFAIVPDDRLDLGLVFAHRIA